jgi:hypothetical protein
MRSNVFAGSVITADSPFRKRPVDPVRLAPEWIISRSCCWRTSVIAGEARFYRALAVSAQQISKPSTLSRDWRRLLAGAARERGGPLPSIDVADGLLDERREPHTAGCCPGREGTRETVPVKVAVSLVVLSRSGESFESLSPLSKRCR